jgi:hypothetical protein
MHSQASQDHMSWKPVLLAPTHVRAMQAANFAWLNFRSLGNEILYSTYMSLSLFSKYVNLVNRHNTVV